MPKYLKERSTRFVWPVLLFGIMSKKFSRRKMLAVSGKAAVLSVFVPRLSFAGKKQPLTGMLQGGDAVMRQTAQQILADGGNAADAVAAAILVAMVRAPSQCAIGA